jgi:uncharacterized protein YaaN involved in tellurite resistance
MMDTGDHSLALRAQSLLSEIQTAGTAFSKRLELVDLITSIGDRTMGAGAQKSRLMQASISDSSSAGDNGTAVENGIRSIHNLMRGLNPEGIDFKAKGLMNRIFNPAKAYFSKFQELDKSIGDAVETLDAHKSMLKNDNITLGIEQAALRELTASLDNEMNVCEEIIAAAEKAIASGTAQDCHSESVQFINDRIIQVLRRKSGDMRQMSVANLQTIMAMELVIRNNAELIRHAEGIEHITLDVLQTAAYVARATYNQTLSLQRTARMSASAVEAARAVSQSAKDGTYSPDTLKARFSEAIAIFEQAETGKEM